MKTTKKHAIWFHACILYRYVCVGGHINIFSGGPQSSSYGPAHATLNSDTTTPPPQLPTSPGPSPPPLTNCDPHQSLCAALDWSLPHPALTANYLFWQSDKRLFFFCTTHTVACKSLGTPCRICENVNNFNKIREIIQNACYFLFSTVLSKIFYIKYVYI